MAVYPLNKFNKKGNILYPHASSYSEEYAKGMCKWYLTDHHYRDEHGRFRTTYQLHSNEPQRFSDYMVNDIMCPKCGSRMHPYAAAENNHDLAHYFCQNCHKE